MSMGNVFKKIKNKMIIKKEEETAKNVSEYVKEGLAKTSEEKLSILRERMNPVLEKEFEPRETNMTLTEQYEHFTKEKQYIEENHPNHFNRFNGSLTMRPHSSIDGFLFYAEPTLKEFGIDITDFKKGDSVGFQLTEAYYDYHYNYTNRLIPDNLKRIANGIKGEERLLKELETWSISEEFEKLSNCVLEFNGKSFETDAMIFSRFGVFSVEVKNIGEEGSFSIHIKEDGQWIKKKEKNEEPLPNITSQVNYHVSMTEAMLKKYSEENNVEIPKLESVVVIANENVKIKNESEMNVLRIDAFLNKIRRMEPIYSKEEMKKMKEWFEQFAINEKGYRFTDYFGELKYRIEQMEAFLKRFGVLCEVLLPIYDKLNKEKKTYKEFSEKGTEIWYGKRHYE